MYIRYEKKSDFLNIKEVYKSYMTKTLHFCNKAETFETVKHSSLFTTLFFPFVSQLYKMLKSPSINLKEKKH